MLDVEILPPNVQSSSEKPSNLGRQCTLVGIILQNHNRSCYCMDNQSLIDCARRVKCLISQGVKPRTGASPAYWNRCTRRSVGCTTAGARRKPTCTGSGVSSTGVA